MQKNYLTNGDDRLFVKSPVDQQDFNDPVVFDLNTDFDFDFFVDDLVVSQVMIDAENNIFGFDGNDRIDAGFQNDTIYGGYGNDAISGGKSVVNLMSIDLSRTFFLGENNQRAKEVFSTVQKSVSFGGDDIVYGGIGNDKIWGYEGNDLVVSGQGDDVIYGGRSVFLVEGRSEIKDIVYDFDVYIEPFYLDDRFFDEYYEKISMVGVLVKGGDDEIYGGDGKDYIDGGSDQDALYGGQGADMIYGGDYLVLDSVQSESYIHTIENLFDYNYDYKLKQNGSILQRVFISGGNDIIFGGVGSDVINGQDGADEMYGGNDDDYIYGGRSGVVDVGYENIDVHEETTYDFYDIKDKRSTFIKEEIVFGGNDLVYAGHGLDRVYGGGGNDVLYGGVGDDYLYGGESFVLTLKRSEILDYFFDNNHMSWYDYEKTSQKDLVVNGGVDSIYGDWGNDYIDGGSDQDLIYGGEGDDHLSGGKGVALVLHESTYFYEMDDYSDVSESTEGYVSVFVSGGDDFIYGGSGSDYIDGCDGNDVLYGGNQNDVIYGGLDQDYVMMSWSVKDQAELKELLHVSGGDDVLFGGDGSDIIYGKNGSDKIDGGAGVDLMYGGDGSDFYLVDDAKDQIIEFDDQGNDSVESAFSHSLGDNVENLILLSGYSAYNGSGNQLDNAINGIID